MGIPGSANPMLFGGAAAYKINQSLRFNSADSTVLSLAASTSNTSTKFTFSFWMKPAKIGGATGDIGIWLVEGPNSSESAIQIGYNWNAIGDAKIGCYWHQTGTSNNYNGGATNAVYRDPSAWYHFVIAIDTTQASGSDRFKVYANGVLQDRTFDTSNYIPQNYAAQFNAYTQKIGKGANFYLSEFYLIRDQALTPSSFGETDTITGAWIPKKYAAAYGSKDIYFKFESSGVGTDSSGNSNTWTANNFSTSGTGTDVMSDTPTNNYATLNPLRNATGNTLSDGNLQMVSNVSTYGSNYATIACPTSGKWYMEVTPISINWNSTGLLPVNLTDSSTTQAPSQGYTYTKDGTVTKLNVVQSYTGQTWSANDVIGVAYNADAGEVSFYKNNSFVYTITGVSSESQYFFVADINNVGSSTNVVNFGQRAFAYTPPTGFKALNTANLPEPTIKKGGAHFNTVLWTGDGTSSHAITGVGFQPDWVWLKSRSLAQAGNLIDAVRGVDKYLRSSSTAAEATFSFLSSFDTDGFTLGTSDAGANQSSATYVAWNWKANGAGSSNTAGSITSTVSANATAGFSIVTYTGNGTAGATVGHGLGVAPKMIIAKIRTQDSDGNNKNWNIYHAGVDASSPQNYVMFFTTSARVSDLGFMNNTAPTSTVFSVGDSYSINNNTKPYVAYCFSEVAGYSKFGSYTGNGSSDGPFVFTNFRPAWIMIKDSTGSGNSWYISDNKRNTYNVVNGRLMANLSNDESTSISICDFTSNGFKIRTSDSGWNTSSSTYIFAAFSETAFKFANAR